MRRPARGGGEATRNGARPLALMPQASSLNGGGEGLDAFAIPRRPGSRRSPPRMPYAGARIAVRSDSRVPGRGSSQPRLREKNAPMRNFELKPIAVIGIASQEQGAIVRSAI